MATQGNTVNATNGGADSPPSPAYFTQEDKIDPETGLEKTYSERRGSLIRASIHRKPDYQYEDPFGEDGVETGGTQYRSMEWWQAGLIMIAETISLGILSLPSVLARVGLVPGIILILGLGFIATYTGYVIGQFKLAYPFIHTFAEAGEVLFTPIGWGPFGRELFGGAQLIFWIFTMGSHILTWTIMLNTVTDHGTCTIVFSIVGLIIFWLLDLPRTLKSVSWFSIASFASIITAVFITMIDVGIDPKPGYKHVDVTRPAEFTLAFNSVSNIVFAYAGHVSFFSFISELKKPQDFPKALYMLQITDTTLYVVAAIVIYRYTGQEVVSPALGSAGMVVSKVAWGIAIPTILIAGVIFGHVATKYIFVRIFRGSNILTAKTVKSYGTWAAISLVLWIIAWIIAESIPVFNDLLSLISALFASWFTYGISAVFWIFLNWDQLFSSPKKILLLVINVLIFVMATAICGIGLYASGKSIHDDAGSSNGSWTCANNA